MPVEPTTYRIKRFDPDPDPEAEPVKFSSGETFLVDFEDGYAVVKDSRLQAIADAPRCEHDKIDEHDYQGKVEGGWHTMICEGAHELRALLKDLTKENSDSELAAELGRAVATGQLGERDALHILGYEGDG